MKKLSNTLLYMLVTLLAATVLPACTHNNGDIGELFGTWQVEMTSAEAEVLYVSFQGDIINLRGVKAETRSFTDYAWGNWSRSADDLTLSFPDNWFDNAAPFFHTGEKSFTVHIDALSSSALTLSWDVPDVDPETGKTSTISYKMHLTKVK